MTMVAKGFVEKPLAEILAIAEKDQEKRTMTFRLSENDVIRYNQHFVDTYDEMQIEQASFAELQKEHRELVKSLKKKMDDLRSAAKKGEEERTVDCYKVFDYTNKSVEYYIQDDDNDDMAVRVFVRNMTAGERQLNLNIHPIKEAM